MYSRLQELGPDTGVEKMHGQMPELARREVAHIICDYREVHMTKERTIIYTLEWKHAGTVWAVDFTKPPKPVDGIYPFILVIRDLASGEDLMSLPVHTKTAQTARNGLESCIKEHGAPLVIKSDNDGAFTSPFVSRYLYFEYGIIFFLTPVRYPCYNGACEAGIGSLKTRAHHESARWNRAGEWTCDDVEAARILVNTTARPKGAKGPVPEEMWEKRKPVDEAVRRRFIRAVERTRKMLTEKEGWLEETEMSKKDEKRIERQAIKSALEHMGFLLIRRKELVR
jgi:transposase InsO family protein